MHAALALVDAGTADAAIGLEASLRPVFRRDFHKRLRVQPLRGHFPHELHLLARHSDQQLIDRIEDALARISIDEHAALLQHWARQTLADRWHHATIRTPRWVLPVISMALLALFVSLAVCRRRRGRLQAQQRERNHASGMVNHEVRNAAQAMVTAVDLLKQSALPAGAHELASIAANAGQTLRRLLNRALDFSRLADGSFRPRPRPCAPAALC
ncbi:MAG TPA: transcriptional regulator, partial [Stenotrophomonas sp.]|nr:transcriptional regulator [Stenotrophomonas sp.]